MLVSIVVTGTLVNVISAVNKLSLITVLLCTTHRLAPTSIEQQWWAVESSSTLTVTWVRITGRWLIRVTHAGSFHGVNFWWNLK